MNWLEGHIEEAGSFFCEVVNIYNPLGQALNVDLGQFNNSFRDLF